MARRPQEDPRVTDLRRYRRERERARRARPPKKESPGGESLLGNRRNAGLILILVLLALLAFSLLSGHRF